MNFFCRHIVDTRVNYFLFKITLMYIPLDYYGKGTKSFDILTGDQELEVCMDTYGPEIDQSHQQNLLAM